MVNEFDKEIDAILRKARAGEAVTSFDSHLGADDISAFAENALPDAARMRYTAHLADCVRCRKILSSVIALNSEAEPETASSIIPAQAVEAATPWYRKLFFFPQLAYTMGGFVLLFSAFFGYLVLQNLTGSKSFDVSRSVDKSEDLNKSAPQPAPTVYSASNSSAPVASNTSVAPANPSAAANSSVTTGATPQPASNTAPANGLARESKPGTPEINMPVQTQPMVAPQPTPQDSLADEDRKTMAKTPTLNEASNPNAASGAARTENKQREKSKEESNSKDDQPVTDGESEQKLKNTRSAPNSPKKAAPEAGRSRSVGGKSFNNVGGIWFDSAYSNQKQKTVDRGTGDYQKLDSGLRSIAEQFSGTVIVVWKSKAYRIQ